MTPADLDQLTDEVTDALTVLANLIAGKATNGWVLVAEPDYLDLVARAHGARP